MADEHPSAVRGVLRRPFAEQVAFFRQKLGNLVPTRRWDDLTGSAHDKAFVVAGAQKADLLTDLAAAVDRAIAEGKSLDAFTKDFETAVERNDWHGWTGEDTKGGRAWRVRTIYSTNTYSAYAAGRLAQLREGKFALWVYRHGGSEEPRPEHLSWDGIALPPEHPFWTTHYPPSDWGCSCYVVGARDAAGVRRLGGDPDKTLPPGWDRIDPKTGAPVGIGKGWAYAPGASVAEEVSAAAGKVRHWDYQIGKAYMDMLPPPSRDAIATAYRRLPSVSDDARRYARRVLGEGGEAFVQPTWTLGSLVSDDLTFIAQVKSGKAADVAGYDFSLTPDDIRHVARSHGGASEANRGQVPVAIDDYELLPAILSTPDRREDAGISDIGEPLVRYVKLIGTLRYVAVMAIRTKRRTLALKTFYIQRAG